MAITEAMIEQYQHPRIKMKVGSVTLYEDDIVSGSFSYKCGTSAGGAFAPGGCVIGACSFTVYNRDGSYTNIFADDTEIEVYIGYGASSKTATYDLLCTVYVADVTKRNYKIQVKAYDKLRNADKKKWSDFAFPMTVNQIISSAASQANINVAQLPTAGGSISVDLRDEDGNQPELSMTCRQAIAQALLISGNYGYMTANGNLYCGWYTSTPVTINPNRLMDYSISDAQDYTGVQVYGQTVTGSETRLYVLSSGQFMNEKNCAAIQSRLYDALVGVDVRTGSFTCICNPNIRPGQTITLTMPQAGSQITVTVPLMSMTVKGSCKATYSSETVSADEADDLRAKQDKIAEDVARGNYATKKYVDDAIKGGGGGGNGSETILISAVATYPFASNWKGAADGIICEAGAISQGHPYNIGIPLQSISVPSHDAVLALASANSKKIEDIYFPITLSVNGDEMYGQFQGTAYWDDKTSERVSAHAGNVIKIKRMIPATLSSYISSAKHYIGPFPMPYIESESRYKYLRRQGDHWGMV